LTRSEAVIVEERGLFCVPNNNVRRSVTAASEGLSCIQNNRVQIPVTKVSEALFCIKNNRVQMCVTTVSEVLCCIQNNWVQMCVSTVLEVLCCIQNNRVQMCVSTVLKVLCCIQNNRVQKFVLQYQKFGVSSKPLPRFRMCGAIPTILHMPLCRVLEQFNLYPLVYAIVHAAFMEHSSLYETNIFFIYFISSLSLKHNFVPVFIPAQHTTLSWHT
jgi:hypothetical protein